MTAALLNIKWTVQKLNNVDRTHLVQLDSATKKCVTCLMFIKRAFYEIKLISKFCTFVHFGRLNLVRKASPDFIACEEKKLISKYFFVVSISKY